ncbi:RNA polymerase sigma factor, sigma-70 family [Burkholderia sp. YR290]|nr:RNA polymerase sigma factor, sigma-70 family [Burkholderia sp. YR290]
MNDPVSLEIGYREYRGLLFAALGRLAADGFVVTPADADDLVHDFFVDAWSGLERRYQPARATFRTYVYAAFVRFARPRIVRLHRLNGTLRDPAEIANLPETFWNSTQAAEAPGDLARIRDAIADLPATLQEALKYWLATDAASERDVARVLGISRYALRRRLIDALGRVALAIDGLSGYDPVDREVADAVWRGGFTLTETAGRLGLTSQEVRNACLRNQHRMQQSLALIREGSINPQRRRTMVSQDFQLEQLRNRIIAAVNIDTAQLDVDQLLQDVAIFVDYYPEEWQKVSLDEKASIYFAVSRGLGVNKEEADVLDTEANAYAADRAAVGHAFADALVPALPAAASLERLGERLAAVIKPLRERDRTALESQPDVYSAGESVMAPLIPYGVRPIHFVHSTDAISLLLQRAVDADYFPADRALSVLTHDFTVSEINGGGNALVRSQLASQIATMIDLPSEAAYPMLDWMMCAAPAVKQLFWGFSASYAEVGLSLVPVDGGRGQNLFARWSPA